jgi:3-methyladenine DNA glycosylase Tag
MIIFCGDSSGFSIYMWQFVNNKTIVNSWESSNHCPATSNESDAWCKDLKKRGFKFFGPMICYAHMQASCAIVHTKFLTKKINYGQDQSILIS